ncbi:MAG: hypothetical protein HC801_02400 [Nitrospira sp.]|nr:hypothetical protein [Nitrospira sp.]
MRLDLHHDAGHVKPTRLNERGIAQGHPVFDFSWKQLAALGLQFFSHDSGVQAQKSSKLVNQHFAILHVFQRDIETEARHIIGEKDAIPVIDQAASRLKQDLPSTIVFR